MRSPVDDPALGTAERALECAVGSVVEEVIFSVAIQRDESAVGKVECPRRTVLVLFLILPAVLWPRPFGEFGAVERCLFDAVRGEIGDEEGFAAVLGDERETVCAGEAGAPLVQQFSLARVDEDVVCRVIGEQDEVTFLGTDDAVAVFDGRFFSQLTPLRNPAVAEITLSESGLLCADDVGKHQRRCGCGEEAASRKGGLMCHLKRCGGVCTDRLSRCSIGKRRGHRWCRLPRHDSFGRWVGLEAGR